MLSIAEEFLLLALDDKSGRFHPLPERAIDLALAGAVLLELAFEKRVDTDNEYLYVVSREPVGDPLLDEALGRLKGDKLSIKQALASAAMEGSQLKRRTLRRLCEKEVLKEQEHRFLFVLKEHLYPICNQAEEDAVTNRIRQVVMSDTIPEPRDIAIICLMDACDLSTYIFSSEELRQHEGRIKQIARMDFIGQALAATIQHIQEAVLEVLAYAGI